MEPEAKNVQLGIEPFQFESETQMERMKAVALERIASHCKNADDSLLVGSRATSHL